MSSKNIDLNNLENSKKRCIDLRGKGTRKRINMKERLVQGIVNCQDRDTNLRNNTLKYIKRKEKF
jgi:hypothetical protein